MSRLSKGDPSSFSEPGIYFGIKSPFRSTNEFENDVFFVNSDYEQGPLRLFCLHSGFHY